VDVFKNATSEAVRLIILVFWLCLLWWTGLR